MSQAEQREAALKEASAAAQAEATAAKAAAAASQLSERNQDALVTRQAAAINVLRSENDLLLRKVNKSVKLFIKLN